MATWKGGSMPIRILLADDHVVVRQGLRALLEAHIGFKVIGEACDGIEALTLVKELKPDVTVLDIMMPGLNGLEVSRQVQNLTKVVILSMYNDRSYVSEALQQGALGFVLKDASAEELILAIQAACLNEYYLSKPFSDHPISTYIKDTQIPKEDPYETLTVRERQVLQLIVEGNRTDSIAKRLGISPRTVEQHRAHIMEKYCVHTQTELVKRAIKKGLISF
jgi:two-component system, NarL family, response regulator NreC